MIRNITIEAVLNGFEVKVGCTRVVFTDITEMLKEIKRYLKNPEGIEKEYLEGALNAKHMIPLEHPASSTGTSTATTVPTSPLYFRDLAVSSTGSYV